MTDYRVLWSKRRQKRTLAACHIEKRKVVVAKELCHPKWERWLDPLLYHEMCHAVIGEKPEIRNGKRLWHGPQFRALERRHPGIQEFDRWIREGGWLSAVRSARSREYHARKKSRGSCQ